MKFALSLPFLAVATVATVSADEQAAKADEEVSQAWQRGRNPIYEWPQFPSPVPVPFPLFPPIVIVNLLERK
ncbi:hypothetical protein BDB00DRAFT_869961 [Zychaea mexicana]|uniref:uncharacterized protein n=1 Tax=Zychaea mexicana TaxID=64656 RepID=UPI0022FE6354|nr:uncharacterized protein BDB00DRAFT_869961 [Zychaea mexicana]KAI9496060.1 hypothetical protein BDB00DRAFT_869961 [Zychaea mexicana]